jgi:Holliday junction resolvase RusA-like endonuclease
MLKSAPKRERQVGTGFRVGRVDDIDKLVRAVLDGLTSSGLIGDDGNVVDLHASKRTHAHGWLGADITVRPALLFPGLDPLVEQR